MIIPVKCFSCGKVLADKYRMYLQRVIELKGAELGSNHRAFDKVVYFNDQVNGSDPVEKAPEGIALDELGLTKPCCRCRMLTHVDIE